jgi:hypothetical protein
VLCSPQMRKGCRHWPVLPLLGVAAHELVSAGRDPSGELWGTELLNAQDSSLEWFQRVWMFGPKRQGPNMLLCPDRSQPSLFDASPEAVLVLTKSKAAAAPASAAQTGPEGGENGYDSASDDETVSQAEQASCHVISSVRFFQSVYCSHCMLLVRYWHAYVPFARRQGPV